VGGYPLDMPGSAGFQLLRRPLGWDLTPADVLRLVRDDAHPVALFGDWAGGGDVVASEPVLVRAAPDALGDVLDRPFPPGADDDRDGDPGPEAAAFGGGWIGYLGYNAGGEALPATGPRALPAWWFGYYDHVLRRDRATGEWAFEVLWTPGRAAALDARLTELTSRAAPSSGLAYRFSPFRLVPSPARHQAAVGAAVDYIRQGDIFQANITLRAEAELTGDPLDAFCQAASALQPPYAAFVGVSAAPGARRGPAARAAVASLSPELFLRRSGDVVASKPIKGTARRAADAREADVQRAGLEASAKDRAENVMIVDLVRNDLSRVCVPGSVTVPVLLGPEPHPGVWHLVSTVTGTLSPGAGDGDLVRATFPPGSVTGAPKVRALEVIDELETAPREVYTGAIGYRSPAAGLELNVAIRTFEFAAGRAWLGAGGGIVADSDPAAEYAECLIKATPLLTAVGARLDPDLPARGGGGEADRETAGGGLAAVLPRPAAGVFTSLLVTAGETRGLAAHLARLAGSVRDLYGKELPASLPDALARVLAGHPTGRLRVTVRPVGGPLQATVEVVPLGPRPSSVTLRPVTVPGGIGPHKYRDRRLLTDLAAREHLAPDEQLLVTDETGELLETDRACLFAVIDGVLLTPPADGRLLPGTTRAAALRAAHALGVRVGQKPLTLDELAAATEVFATNAVAGVLPVTAIRSGTVVTASAARWTPGPVAAAIAAALDARPPDEPFTPPAVATPSRQGAARRAITFPLAPGRSRPAIVMIDNYDSFTWNLAHLLETAGARVEVVRNDEVTADEVIAAAPAGVVISPGPCAPAEAGISIATVTACAAAGVPLLGICLGHQAIGAAFGASVVPAPRPVHGQAFDVRHDGTGVLRGLPDPFQATRYHSLIVDEATRPASLLVTARTDGLPMALRHRTLPIEGVQFHPESILTTHGAAIMAAFVATAAKPR
jgi:para-aminobenzoate synthetase/4-amino-4-deoxychorismate lyase